MELESGKGREDEKCPGHRSHLGATLADRLLPLLLAYFPSLTPLNSDSHIRICLSCETNINRGDCPAHVREQILFYTALTQLDMADLTDAMVGDIITCIAEIWRNSMAIYLIDIEQKQLQAIEQLVKLSRYESLEQFVELAIRNQIFYETNGSEFKLGISQGVGQGAVGKGKVKIGRGPEKAKRGNHNRLVAKPSWAFTNSDIEPFPDAKPTTRPLWGQFYRFLPVKLVVRLLAQAQSEQPAEMKEFFAKAVAEALDLADRLRSIDDTKRSTNGLSLAAGFPSAERDWSKSSQRFFSQYVGRVRSDGTLDGFLAALGFATLRQDDRRRLIGLTNTGIEFASLPNPVLDNGDVARPFSDEEISFLIDYIARWLSGEKDQLREIVQLISQGVDIPKELDSHLGEYYRARYSDEKWTDAKVSVMRAGAVSRLAEVGVINVVKKGVRVEYKLAEQQHEVLKPILTSERLLNEKDILEP